MQGSGVADLLTPPLQEEVHGGEEHGEEHPIGEVQGKWNGVRSIERGNMGRILFVWFQGFVGGGVKRLV